jgi:BirA family transcriptional regulator, biotin operon repressor / biotin---[acetyl-CoA-carboxylase] ligase
LSDNLSADWPDGVGRVVLAEVDSTNAHAIREAAQHAGPVWFLGLRQTAGKGRRGREWRDPAGNFAATYLCRPVGPLEQTAQRSFIAALALYDALLTVTGRPEGLALKWPNDVLLNGGKVAGILLESAGAGQGVQHLAVGIGVNLLAAPDGTDSATAPVSLSGETGVQITPEEFLNILAPAYARWEHQLATYGFAPIRTAWLARAARLGQIISARTVTETLTGTFVGIDPTGALVLHMAQGRRTIPAADVFF